jgi:hypothetical protein
VDEALCRKSRLSYRRSVWHGEFAYSYETYTQTHTDTHTRACARARTHAASYAHEHERKHARTAAGTRRAAWRIPAAWSRSGGTARHILLKPALRHARGLNPKRPVVASPRGGGAVARRVATRRAAWPRGGHAAGPTTTSPPGSQRVPSRRAGRCNGGRSSAARCMLHGSRAACCTPIMVAPCMLQAYNRSRAACCTPIIGRAIACRRRWSCAGGGCACTSRRSTTLCTTRFGPQVGYSLGVPPRLHG